MSARRDGYLASEDIVINLKRDVVAFQEDVCSLIDTIRNKAASMESAWQDSQYTDFMSYIDELTTALKSDVRQLEEAVAALNKEVR